MIKNNNLLFLVLFLFVVNSKYLEENLQGFFLFHQGFHGSGSRDDVTNSVILTMGKSGNLSSRNAGGTTKCSITVGDNVHDNQKLFHEIITDTGELWYASNNRKLSDIMGGAVHVSTKAGTVG